MKTLLVKTPTQTSAIAISQSRTVKMLVDADAQYQLIDKQNRPIQKPKTKRVGDDLWVFDEVGEAVELVLEKYYNVHPVAYPANDLEYLADMSNPFGRQLWWWASPSQMMGIYQMLTLHLSLLNL